MKKVYLVDSENVGDVWVPLLASSLPDEEVVVFYTQQSPHMGYENVRLLKETEKTPVFIKCFEGRNALDFQLVTELGYRLRADEECEYVLISTDAGFDAAVRYWTSQKKKVRRLNGKECYRQATGKLRRSGMDAGEIPMAEPAEMQTADTTAGNLEESKVNTAKKEEKAVASVETAEVVEKLGTAEKPESAEPAKVQETASVAVMESTEAAEPTAANEQPEKTKTGAKRRRRRETRKRKAESEETSAIQEMAEQVMQEVQQESVTESWTEAKGTRLQSAEQQEKTQQKLAAVPEKTDAQTKATEEIPSLTEKALVPAAVEVVQETSLAEAVQESASELASEATAAEVVQEPSLEESVQEAFSTESAPERDDTEQIVTSLFRCIHKDNLTDFHNAMVMFLGEEDGKRLYLEAKNSPECNAFWAEQADNSQKERFDIYCKMVFTHSEPAEETPADFAEFLWKANGKRKNLNSLRAALQAQYGKDKGMKYYSLFKSHIKIMNRM